MKNIVSLTLIALLATLLIPGNAFAQEVEGTVNDAETEDVLPGVNVVVKGTQIGTATDVDGNYTLSVPTRQDTLVFSFVGYQEKEVPINGRSTVDVSLETQERQLDEVVVSGYQQQRRETNTGAVSIAETQDYESESSANAIKSLQGQVPGVTITTDGRPSGEGSEVRIRGESTLNNNNPLYVIDGTPTKESAFQVLNGDDIASLQVLKSAPSSSIYGARASNGVIVVETKKGTSGDLQVDYSSKLSVNRYGDKMELCDRECRATAQLRALAYDGNDPDANMPNITPDWERGPDGEAVINDLTFDENIIEGYPTADTDWQDVIARNGVKQNHTVSATVGGDASSAYLSLNVFDNQYITEEKSFTRFSARVNTEFSFFDGSLRVGENLMINNSIDRGLKGGSAYGNAFDVRPMIPVYTTEDELTGPPTGNFADNQNPLQVLRLNKDDERSDLNIFGNVFLDVDVTNNITLSSHAGVDLDGRREQDIDRRYFSGFMSRDPNVLINENRQRDQLNFNQTAEYQNRFGNHEITVLGGGEIVNEKLKRFGTRSTNFAVQNIDFLVEESSVGERNASGSKSEYTILSGFTKIDYAYNNKYLLSGTLRRDGSSKLGENNRWGTFPAISAGWRLGQEDFVQENTDFITSLKLRGEWGKTGNQDIDPEASFTIFRPNYGSDRLLTPPWARGYDFAYNGTAYDIKGQDTGSLPSGFVKEQTGNEDLKWEEATEFNIGLDFGLFNNQLTGTLEYYDRTNEDILIQPPFLAVKGEGGDQFFNGATVEVSGFEATATYDGNAGPVDYSVTGNATTINDEITELPSEVVDAFPGNREKTILGRSQNALFGYVADGIFDNEEEVENHAEQTGAKPGRLRYKDLNGDGEITPLDQKYLGTSTPDWEYGLNVSANLGDFDFRMFWQGVYGLSVFDDRKSQTDFTSLWSGTNYGRRTLDAWRPNNKDSSIPALTLQDTNNEGRPSTYFISNGRYLKLRDVTIGYTLDGYIPYASRARVFFSAENILEFHDTDSFTSQDPENPNEGGFPRPQEFTMGVNLSF